MLSVDFSDAALPSTLQWLNEPHFQVIGRQLAIEPNGETDFWQRTAIGKDQDNGHFLHKADVQGDFIMRTRVHFEHKHNYDQAGLMVRFSKGCWIKANLEQCPTGVVLAVVVTNNGYSDLSTTRWLGPEVLELQIRREGTAYYVDAKIPDRGWEQIRLANLIEDGPGKGVSAGLYGICPVKAGFVARFDYLTIVPGCLADNPAGLTPASKTVAEAADFAESKDDAW